MQRKLRFLSALGGACMTSAIAAAPVSAQPATPAIVLDQLLTAVSQNDAGAAASMFTDDAVFFGGPCSDSPRMTCIGPDNIARSPVQESRQRDTAGEGSQESLLLQCHAGGILGQGFANVIRTDTGHARRVTTWAAEENRVVGEHTRRGACIVLAYCGQQLVEHYCWRRRLGANRRGRDSTCHTRAAKCA